MLKMNDTITKLIICTSIIYNIYIYIYFIILDKLDVNRHNVEQLLSGIKQHSTLELLDIGIISKFIYRACGKL